MTTAPGGDGLLFGVGLQPDGGKGVTLDLPVQRDLFDSGRNALAFFDGLDLCRDGNRLFADDHLDRDGPGILSALAGHCLVPHIVGSRVGGGRDGCGIQVIIRRGLVLSAHSIFHGVAIRKCRWRLVDQLDWISGIRHAAAGLCRNLAHNLRDHIRGICNRSCAARALSAVRIAGDSDGGAVLRNAPGVYGKGFSGFRTDRFFTSLVGIQRHSIFCDTPLYTLVRGVIRENSSRQRLRSVPPYAIRAVSSYRSDAPCILSPPLYHHA